MSIFLFAKQIVDMFYEFKILDILMVICATIMCIYQIGLIKPPIKSLLRKADVAIIILAVLLSWTTIRWGRGFIEYAKIMSAFLMYLLGRVCHERIEECYKVLSASGYLIVYSNLIYRIMRWKGQMFAVRNAEGDLYYNDTDMAFAIILAMVFIFMFAGNTLLKLTTVFAVCPYMVICSEAGSQVLLMLAIYMILMLYIAEKALQKTKLFRLLALVPVIILIIIIAFCYLPVFSSLDRGVMATIFNNGLIQGSGLYSHYEEWNNALSIMISEGNVFTLLFGTGIAYRVGIESLYIGCFYTVGLTGCLVAVFFLIEILRQIFTVRSRKICYIACIMCIMLLGTGVMKSSMDRTQMSWFPMLFWGMMYAKKFEE